MKGVKGLKYNCTSKVRYLRSRLESPSHNPPSPRTSPSHNLPRPRPGPRPGKVGLEPKTGLESSNTGKVANIVFCQLGGSRDWPWLGTFRSIYRHSLYFVTCTSHDHRQHLSHDPTLPPSLWVITYNASLHGFTRGEKLLKGLEGGGGGADHPNGWGHRFRGRSLLKLPGYYCVF